MARKKAGRGYPHTCPLVNRIFGPPPPQPGTDCPHGNKKGGPAGASPRREEGYEMSLFVVAHGFDQLR